MLNKIRTKQIVLSVVLLAGTLIFGLIFNNTFAASECPVVKLDGKEVNFPDVKPFVNEDDRTMVPVRFVSEALGCTVTWEETNEIVIITRGDTRILLHIGDNSAIVNTKNTDTKKEFDTKAVLKDDRTMVPLRFVSETMGAGVVWDEAKNTVIIRSDGTVEVVATPVPTVTPATMSIPTATPSSTKFPDIIRDHTSPKSTLKPTTTYSATPNPWKDVEEPMTLIEEESDPMPEAFIQPQFVVKHLMSGSAGYFDILLKNIVDYKDSSADYTFKVTCLNYDIVNWTTNIPDITRTDDMRNLSGYFMYPYLTPGIWGSPSSDIHFKSHPELGSLSMGEGLVLDMQLEFYYGGLKQVYRNSVCIHNK